MHLSNGKKHAVENTGLDFMHLQKHVLWFYELNCVWTYDPKRFKVNIISFRQCVGQPGFPGHVDDFHSVDLNTNPQARPSTILSGKGL